MYDIILKNKKILFVYQIILLVLLSLLFGCKDDNIRQILGKLKIYSDRNLTVEISTVDFGFVPTVCESKRKTYFANEGDGSLFINEFSGIATPFEVDLSHVELPLEIPTNDFVVLNIVYNPSQLNSSDLPINILTDNSVQDSYDLLLTGSGTNDTPSMKVECPRDDDPSIISTCNQLKFGNVELGNQPSLTATVKNDGVGNILISGVKVVGDDNSAYNVISLPEEGVVLEENSEHPITVDYTPKGFDNAELLIISSPLACQNADLPDYKNPFTVFLNGSGVVPDIQVCNLIICNDLGLVNLDFSNAVVSETTTKSFTVQNIGRASLAVSSLSFTNETSNEFQVETTKQVPFALEQSEEIIVNINYNPSDGNPDEGALVIESDDPDEPEVIVYFNGSSKPDIDVTPESVDFINVEQGSLEAISVQIVNNGYSELQVEEIYFDQSNISPDFSLENLPSFPLLLTPGDSSEFAVNYNRQGPGNDVGLLIIKSNDPDENPMEINVNGYSDPSLDNYPPIANSGGDQVVSGYDLSNPYSITLDGNASIDDHNRIVLYEWVLVFKPEGSQTSLSSQFGVTTSFIPDRYGRYRFGLIVYDDLNQASTRDDVEISINN